MRKPPLLSLLIVVVTSLTPGASAESIPLYPELWIAVPDANSVQFLPCDHAAVLAMMQARSAKLAENEALELVVVTHGWFERKNWTREMMTSLEEKVGESKVICGCFEWRGLARRIRPVDTVKAGVETAGPCLGDKILKLSQDWGHVHLISHSAGAWVISEASESVAKHTEASIHLTFLDAYVPAFWDESRLGKVCEDPNVTYWADHYITRDLTLGSTEKPLTHAHNVDLTKIDPGINDHEFPRYWYHATIIGRYAENQRYAGKRFWYRTNGINYGFERSLEAGADNWEQSLKLKIGEQTVKITPDTPPAWLEGLSNLFK